ARPARWPRRAVRFVRKHPVLCVLLLLLVGALASLAAAYLLSPQRRLESAQQRLARGETVELIGENGPPLWSSLLFYGRDTVAISEKSNQPYSISPLSTAAVELLPKVPLPRYRIRALVQQEDGILTSTVGLYVGRRQYSTPTGTEHYLYELTFKDHPLGDQRLPLRLNLRRLSDPPAETDRNPR